MSLLNLQDLLPGNSKDPIGKNLFDFVDDRKEDLSNLVGSGFKTVDSFIDQNIPGGEQFTDNWSTGINEINEKISGTTEALKRRSQEPIDSIDDIGPWALGSFIKGSEDTTEAARTVAEAAGIDPRAGDIVGGLATEAALFGVGKLTKGVSKFPPPKTPKFALATQSSRPGLLQLSLQRQDSIPNKANLTPQVMDLTIKDPTLVAPGIKHGSARSPEWIEQTRDFDMRRAAAKEKVASATSKSAKRNFISDMFNEVSTGPTRRPGLAPAGDPHAYKDAAFKRHSVIEKLKDGSPKWKEQHHLFSKQESYQFVERMIEIGDDDDVLSMFLFAEDLDATMGGRLSNMLNMERKPHSLLHSSRKRRIDGRELKSDEMRNLVNSAKTSTELMKLFNKYIIENVRVSIDEAKAFNAIADRMIENNKYGFIQELYDKNILRKPVWRDY